MNQNGPVYVDVDRGPDENDRFLVYVDGGMERWTLAMIKLAAATRMVREWLR